MVQIILIAARALSELAGFSGANDHFDDRWQRDPLAHPVLGAMSLNELADLPPLRSCCRE